MDVLSLLLCGFIALMLGKTGFGAIKAGSIVGVGGSVSLLERPVAFIFYVSSCLFAFAILSVVTVILIYSFLVTS